jgi:hypothetical protein
MTKGAPILRTAVRTKLRLELSYRDVFLPGTLTEDQQGADGESQDRLVSQRFERDFLTVLAM